MKNTTVNILIVIIGIAAVGVLFYFLFVKNKEKAADAVPDTAPKKTLGEAMEGITAMVALSPVKNNDAVLTGKVSQMSAATLQSLVNEVSLTK